MAIDVMAMVDYNQMAREFFTREDVELETRIGDNQEYCDCLYHHYLITADAQTRDHLCEGIRVLVGARKQLQERLRKKILGNNQLNLSEETA